MDCANTLHQVRRNSQMVHERVSLQIIQVFGLVDFFDHSIDCFYQYSSGISPAVSDCFFPLQQSGLIGQRCSLCGQVFIYEDSLVFVNAVVPSLLTALWTRTWTRARSRTGSQYMSVCMSDVSILGHPYDVSGSSVLESL